MAFTDERNTQKIIDLMRQTADSLDKLGTYPLNDKQLFGGDCVISDFFSKHDNIYYQTAYFQHLGYYDSILTWLDYNKSGVVNTLEREHNRILDNAKALDQNYRKIKYIYTKQFPDIVKANDPSLDPEEFKKAIKHDHAFKVSIFVLEISNFAGKFRNLVKQLEKEFLSGSSKKPAGAEGNNAPDKCQIIKRITGWIFKKTSHFIWTLIVSIIAGLIVAVLVDIFGEFGWLERIKAFIYNILQLE
ncbi:MAG: biotin transporter BioY [Planctomycetes bacterium]|nr:biotin transporter BioY [Planctomycetota bacterium]